jgi:hypothetical protein
MGAFKQSAIIISNKSVPVEPSIDGDLSVVARDEKIKVYDGNIEETVAYVSDLENVETLVQNVSGDLQDQIDAIVGESTNIIGGSGIEVVESPTHTFTISVSGDYATNTYVDEVSGNLQDQIDNIVQESTTIESSGGSIIVTHIDRHFNIESATQNHNELNGLNGVGGDGGYWHLTEDQYNDYVGRTEVQNVSGDLQNQIDNIVQESTSIIGGDGIEIIEYPEHTWTISVSGDYATNTFVNEVSGNLQDQINDIVVEPSTDEGNLISVGTDDLLYYEGYFDNNHLATPAGWEWTARTLSTDLNWRSVCYGNGLFVAVGISASIATSPDGINWTIRTSPDDSWNTVCYGNGLFVALNNDTFITSPDGINWTMGSLPVTKGWRSVCYGNGLFVAVTNTFSDNQQILTSPDGINWTIRTSQITGPFFQWQSVCYGNGLFVACGVASKAMYSSNGIDWTIITTPTAFNWQSVCYGNGLFVAVSFGGNGIITSPDGINWTIQSIPAVLQFASVCYGQGLFVTVAYNSASTPQRVMTSPDGINWTLRTTPADNQFISVCYGNGLFVAVATSGTGNRIMTSGWQIEYEHPIDYATNTLVQNVSGDLQDQIDNIVQESTTIESSGGSIIVTQIGNDFNLEVASSGGSAPYRGIDTSIVDISGSTTETEMALIAIPSNTCTSTADSIHFSSIFQVYNNHLSNNGITVKIELGGEILFQDTFLVGKVVGERVWKIEGKFIRTGDDTVFFHADFWLNRWENPTIGMLGSKIISGTAAYAGCAVSDGSVFVDTDFWESINNLRILCTLSHANSEFWIRHHMTHLEANN